MDKLDVLACQRVANRIDVLNRSLSERDGERFVFTVDQAADFLHVGVPFVQMNTKAGRIERVKLGENVNSPVRYTRNALLAYLTKCSERA